MASTVKTYAGGTGSVKSPYYKNGGSWKTKGERNKRSAHRHAKKLAEIRARRAKEREQESRYEDWNEDEY